MKIDGFKFQLAKGKVTYLMLVRANPLFSILSLLFNHLFRLDYACNEAIFRSLEDSASPKALDSRYPGAHGLFND